ncbi:MAG TPA: HAD-IA family hydrolase [Verrucomicrobiales bacterium]|jgi:HAD superfamily hydrolase (TIGR01509 family)|nr:HAD-IA family hydrolase [Verrucomicrobiales bacterium]
MRALIFDFDGLIVDTESAIYEAWRELYLDHGHDLPLPVYVQCVGSTFSQYDPMAALESLTGKPVNWDDVLPRKDARIRELQRELDTLPGIRPLLLEAASRGIPCAIASSSQRTHVQGWLERTGILDAFTLIRTRDDVERAKPAPDLFLAAAHGLGLSPAETLILEDSANGLRAARAAGAPCVIVPSPVTRGSDFTGAHAVIDTLGNMSLDGLGALHSLLPEV